MVSYHYKTLPINTIYNLARKDQIDLEPSYQREVVWTKDQQTDLLTTLIEDKLPCPPINLVENNDPSVPKYECMDGKNRTKALILFMNDELVYEGRKFSEFSEDEKDDFTATNIQVCIFTAMPYDQRREYFRRIQQGKVLRQTEICWSFDNRPIMIAIRRVREECIDIIGEIWDTKRYSDLVFLCNTMAMIIGDDITRDIAGHSTSMTTWVKKGPLTGKFNDEYRTLKEVVVMIGGMLDTMPTSRVRNLVFLDLARSIIANGVENTAGDKFATFVTELNGYIKDGKAPADGNVRAYGDIINNNKALSSQYSRKVIAQRFEIIRKIL